MLTFPSRCRNQKRMLDVRQGIRVRAAAGALAVACAAASAFAQEPAPDADVPWMDRAMDEATPWGEVVDGMACRLLVPRDVCPGQLVSARFQIRNVSDRPRYLIPPGEPSATRYLRLTIEGAATLPPYVRPLETDYLPDARHLRLLPPGETLSVDWMDLNAFFRGAPGRPTGDLFRREGTFDLRVIFLCPRVPGRYVARQEERDGETVDIYEDAPEEALRGAWVGALVSNAATVRIVPLEEQDLAVHEWGVFTVHNDLRLANVDRRREWDELPDFFYRQFPEQRLRWLPAAWDKPVIYFHTRRPSLRVEVRLSFAAGAPVAWWPCAAQPYDPSPGREPPAANRPFFRHLMWEAWLGDRVPATAFLNPTVRRASGWIPAPLFDLPDSCWVRRARAVPEAARVTVMGSRVPRDEPWTTDRIETEKFIYYDGLVPAPDYLACTKSDGAAVTIRNISAFAITNAFVVDNRTAPMRFARADLAARQETPIDLAAAPAPADPEPSARAALRADLLAAGLFESEADALLDIWRDGLFRRPGVTAFYILPPREYERMIRLYVNPVPKKTVRVGLALHPNMEAEPALRAQAQTWTAKLASADEAEGREAVDRLIALGPIGWRAAEARAGGRRQRGRVGVAADLGLRFGAMSP